MKANESSLLDAASRRVRHRATAIFQFILLGFLVGPLEALSASPFVFDDRAAFLAATRAQRDTDPYPASGSHTCYSTGLIVDQICGHNSEIVFGSWTDSLPLGGPTEADISLSNSEQFDIFLDPQARAFSIGFELEDSEGGNSGSTFSVTLFAESIVVGRHIFDPTGNGPGTGSAIGKERTFVGLWSEVAFDRVEIREVQTHDEEEYFGPIHVGLTPPAPWQRKYVSGDTGELYFGGPVSLDGDRAVVGENYAGSASGTILESGAAYIYDRDFSTLNSWHKTQRLEPSDPNHSGSFGASAAISGAVALIAAPYDGLTFNRPNGPGAAYVFVRHHQSPDVWSEVVKLLPTSPNFSFGAKVELRGDLGFVSSRCTSCPGHTVHIYDRNLGGPDAWGKVAEISRPLANGFNFAADGETLVIGAPFDQTGPYPGAAYVFGRNVGGPDAWGEIAKLEASDATNHMLFGEGVEVEGDFVLVGAPRANKSGALYVFERNRGGANQWGQSAKIQSPEPLPNENFGRFMSFDGEVLAVGSAAGTRPTFQGGRSRYFPGRVFLYRRNGSSWSEAGKLVPIDGEDGDFFGVSVSQSGPVTLVGSNSDNDLGLASGSITFFAPFIFGDGFESGGALAWSPKQLGRPALPDSESSVPSDQGQ